MIQRKELNQLVVMTLNSSGICLKAIELYEVIKQEDPKIFRRQQVGGYRSFVKVINQFENIEQVGTRTKKYTVIRKLEIFK